LDAAEAVVADAGLGGLTLAAVAERLGIRVPSLYKHVAGLPDVRRGLSLRGRRQLVEVLTGAVVGKARGEALESLCAAYLSWADRHPALYTAAQIAPDPDDVEDLAASEKVTDVVFAVISGYGADPMTAIDATRTLRAAIHGFAALNALRGFGLERPVEESMAWWLSSLDAALRQSRRVG
jgi:AcrR family transcriptional regulator